MKRYDCLIIGSGTAGAKIAKEFVKRNLRVALIEKDFNVFGGSCINTACIPTKVLIEDSNHGYTYKEAFARKNEIVPWFQASKYKSLSREENITLYDGTASFLSNEVVEVNMDQGKERLTADHIVINTGSTSNIPPIEGMEQTQNIYTSTTILERETLPEKILIVGGGYIGLEFASMYANFGSQVTVLLRGEKLLPHEDEDIAQEIQQVLEDKGITFMFESEVTKVQEDNGTVLAFLNDGQELTADALLLATGRKPNTEELKLEKTSIEASHSGAIDVNKQCESSVPHIWAVGDVRGKEQFTYVSYDDGRQVINAIFGSHMEFANPQKNIQYTMFIDPPLARVGLTEAQAKEKGYEVTVNTVPVRTIGRAHILRDARGLFKAVVDKKEGKILGVSLFGKQSEEIINIIKLAMDENWHYCRMRDQMFNHPIMSEAFNGLFNL